LAQLLLLLLLAVVRVQAARGSGRRLLSVGGADRHAG
jgi:hypothetical protein